MLAIKDQEDRLFDTTTYSFSQESNRETTAEGLFLSGGAGLTKMKSGKIHGKIEIPWPLPIVWEIFVTYSSALDILRCSKSQRYQYRIVPINGRLLALPG